MNDIQRKDLDSARLVLNVLNRNLSLVNADPKLKEFLDFLFPAIEKVDAAGGIQLAGRGGTKEFKDNLKADGSEIGKKWLTALKTVDPAGDLELTGIISRAPSAYGTLGDNEWYQFNLKLIPKCTQYLSQVTKYGRTAGEVGDLTALNTAFLTAMTKPEELTSTLKKATEDVGDGIDSINRAAIDTDK